MKIDGPKKLVTRAAFAAEVLKVNSFSLNLEFRDGHSECLQYSDGSYKIYVEDGVPKKSLIKHIAHEMTHLRQYKLQQLECNDFGARWLGVFYPPYDDPYGDEYWLSPWECEARAMEEYVAFKWEYRER